MHVTLDCEKLSSRRPAHAYLQDALGFPEYYGKNLDALFDCLTGLPDCTIVLRGRDELARSGGYGARILAVLEDAARANPRLTLESGEAGDDRTQLSRLNESI